MRIPYTYSNTPPNENLLFSENKTIAKKQNTILLYEKANHLGNVLSVTSDRKLAHSSNTTTIDYYLADIQSATDYYAFGSPMPGRSFVGANGYRYGFNGKENDNEVKGNGNQQDYGMRIYDPRLGKFLSVDPLAMSYPELTPYQFATNSPIVNIDLDGLEGVQYYETIKDKNGNQTSIKNVIEVDVYVAVSKQANSIHYKASDIKTIKSDLKTEFNKTTYQDDKGIDVEFRFNVKAFDVDIMDADKYAAVLKEKSAEQTTSGGMTERGVVIEKTPEAQLSAMAAKAGVQVKDPQGNTDKNHISVSDKAKNPSHTKAHEVGHFMMMKSGINPGGSEGIHAILGGIFKYGLKDAKHNSKNGTEDLSKDNVKDFLRSVPKISDKTIVK